MGLITYDTLRSYAYSNDRLISGPIRGLVFDFMGLGNQDMHSEDTPRGIRLAGKGIIHLIPYFDPWCWMNDQTVAFCDELRDVLFDHYGLDDGTPVIASGESMGGLCALVYTHYARHTPVTCVTNCPVCDAAFHFTERPDLPRTFYAAFGAAEDFDAALKAHSPLHIAAQMPDIRYVQFHCATDEAVNKEKHSDRFVEAMRPGHRVEYIEVEGQGHCKLNPADRERYNASLEEDILNRQ